MYGWLMMGSKSQLKSDRHTVSTFWQGTDITRHKTSEDAHLISLKLVRLPGVREAHMAIYKYSIICLMRIEAARLRLLGLGPHLRMPDAFTGARPRVGIGPA